MIYKLSMFGKIIFIVTANYGVSVPRIMQGP